MININNSPTATDPEEWKNAQEWERQWHDNCANSFNEEAKQFTYAQRMGLDEFKGYDRGGRTNWAFGDKLVIDIGGGAYSLLLKSTATIKAVVDPCDYPNWVRQRYNECGVDFYNIPAETINENMRQYDIALIYNCLQHTQDPKLIIENVKKIAKEIRIFEWIDTGVSDGHLHDLKEEALNEWLGGIGKVENIREGGCIGKCYYGIFPTNL